MSDVITSQSTIDGILKTYFAGPINKAIEDQTMLLKQLQPTSKYKVKGAKTIKHSILLVPNTSVGFRTASSDGVPNSAPSEAKQAQSVIATLFAYIEFYGDTLRFTKDDVGAYAEAFQTEIMSCSDTMRREINRALYGDGTGVLGLVSNATPSTYILVGNDTTNTSFAPNMRWFDRGQMLDIWDSTGSTLRYAGGFKVIARDRTTYKLTLALGDDATQTAITALNGTYAVAANDIITVRSNYKKEPYGIGAICDNGSTINSFLGISETTYDRWRGIVSTNGATLRALSEQILQDHLDEVLIFDESKKNLLIMTTLKIRNKLARLIKAAGLTIQNMQLKGGWEAIQYSGIPVYADIAAPACKLWTINTDTIIPHVINDSKDDMYKFNAFSFDDEDNQVLHAVRGSDIYWCKGVLNYNFTTRNRAANGFIGDIDANL